MGKVLADRGAKKARRRSPGTTPPARNRSAASSEGFSEGGGQVVKELYAAVPEGRVPGAADRDRLAQARRGVRLLRRRRRGQVRQGLRRGGPARRRSRCSARASSPTARSKAQGDAAQGLETTLHYADGLTLPEEPGFPRGVRQGRPGARPTSTRCRATTRRSCCAPASTRSKGDVGAKQGADRPPWRSAEIDSPRGKFTLSKAHNPVQDIYLRKVVGMENKVHAASRSRRSPTRPDRLCKMALGDRLSPARGRARAAPGGRAGTRFLRGSWICRSRMDFATFLDPVLNGVQYGLLLFLVASAA